jgi:hypothetical protein
MTGVRALDPTRGMSHDEIRRKAKVAADASASQFI